MSTTQSLTLYFVAYEDQNGENQDMFVTATNKLEAFALWRVNQGYVASEFVGEDEGARVFDVPAVGTAPEVYDWNPTGNTNERFDLSLDTLATKAVEQAYDAAMRAKPQ